MVKLNKKLIKDYMNNTSSDATDETYSCDYINGLIDIYEFGNQTIGANTQVNIGTLPLQYQGYNAYIGTCNENGQWASIGVNQTYQVFVRNQYSSQLTFENVKIICIGKKQN